MLIDLDDTILDDSSSVDDCWWEACTRGTQQLDGTDATTLLAAIETHRDWFWSDPERHQEGRLDLRAASRGIVQAALEGLGYDLPELAREIAESYRDLREERLRPFPGAIEALQALRSRGVRLGMITNGSAAGQRAKIERFGLEQYFDYVLVEGEFGLGKPHREVYEVALKAVDAAPAQAWCVGDNLEWDVGAPQRLGIYGVWVDARLEGLPEGTAVRPDRVVCALRELI